MFDRIIDAIRNSKISASNISFNNLRGLAARDHGAWNELGRGRSILTSIEQLDQYLYSYGPMTQSQWVAFAPSATIPSGRYHLADYGCGQGLGCALVFDHFGAHVRGQVESVVLIEPSSVALMRAAAVVGCYCDAPVKLVNKKLDDLSELDVQSNEALHKIHVFSNVLDIDGFDHATLFNKIFRTVGTHTVLAVSHDRTFHGGSNRFEHLEAQVKDDKHRDWFSLEASKINRFTCQNGQPAISWKLRVQVLNGPL
jgi:hypothetical protein